MTAPWAKAEVDVTLNWNGVDDELVQRLSRSSELAARAVQQNLGSLSAGARTAVGQIGDAYADQAAQAQRSQRLVQAAQIATANGASQTANKVRQATATTTTARDKDRQAAERVRSTEQQLATVRGNAASTAQEIAAAEQQATQARDEHTSATNDLETAIRRQTSAEEELLATSRRLQQQNDSTTDSTDDLGESTGGLRDRLRSLTGTGEGAGSMLVGLGKKAGIAAAAFIGFQGAKSFLTAGWDRLSNIDDATKKLEGLGRSSKDIESIMESVKTSVSGTAYGLDAAANSAAVFSTVGVKSGADMDRTMQLLTDTTAAANSTLDEMTPIFTKIRANGGLTTDTFDMLNERATGVGEALQKHLGGSLEDVQAKVKAGEVDFKTFATAMEKNIGGAAKKSGETVRGATANLRAAFSRIAASLLKPLHEVTPQIMGWFTGIADKINAGIGPAMDKIKGFISGVFSGGGDITPGWLTPIKDSIGQAKTLFTDLVASIKTMFGNIDFGAIVDRLQGMGEQVLPILEEVGGFLSDVLGVAFEHVGGMIKLFGQHAVRIFTAIKGPISSVADTVRDTVLPIFKGIAEWARSQVPKISGVFESVRSIFSSLSPVIAKVAGLVGGALATGFKVVWKILGVVITVLKPIVSALFTFIGIVFKVAAAIIGALAPILEWLVSDFGAKFSGVWEWIKNAAAAVADWFSSTVAPFFAAAFQKIGAIATWLWQNVMSPVWSGIKTVIGVVWSAVSVIFQGWMLIFKAIGAVAMWLWKTVMTPVWEGIKAAISVAGTIIGGVITAVSAGFKVVASVAMWLWNNAIVPAWQGIQTAIQVAHDVIAKIIDGVKAVFQSVADKAGEVKDWIVDKWNSVVDFFKKMPSVFSDLAGKIFDPLLNAARSVFNAIARFWNNTIGRISFTAPKWIPGIGGKGFSVPKIPELARGGQVAYRRGDGLLSGPGTGTSDSILGIGDNGMPTARVSAGEFVMNARATKRFLPILRALNRIRGLASGGTVGREPYGMPTGTNISYGAQGFPAWVYEVGDKFGVKPSTYAGHQEGSGQNKGIDWSGPVANMQKFAEYLLSIAPGMEQVIWQNPETGQQIGVADGQKVGPGTSQPGYYRDDWADHTDHVHTRQSYSFGANGSSTKGIDDTPNSGLSTSSGSLSTPIGSGISSSSSGGSPSWGNSGGESRANNSADAKRQGLTPVWVENWPASIGSGGGSGDLSSSGTLATSSSDLSPTVVDGPVPTVSASSSKKDVAAAIYAAARKRGYSHEEALAIVSTAIQESNLDAGASGGGGAWHGYFQQDTSYPDRDDPNGNIKGFLDRLDEKTKTDPDADIWKRIFWLQQRPGETSADNAFGNGRQAYLDEIRSKQDEAKDLVGEVPTTPAGDVPVEVTNLPDPGDAATSSGPDLSTSTPPTSSGTGGQSPRSESMPYGRARADQWLLEQDYGAQFRDIGVAGLKETFGEFGALFGVESFVESGIDQMVAYLRQIAEKDQKAELKYADTVNNYGVDAEKSKQKTTEGMTAVMDTYRNG